ncbi:hypothetical protein A3D11_04090 [Candidatus Peribacteria bacterium RIFCSPHIGHO2_02_FULL_49_16]|nr:MAG: hypothetical protein A2880_00180 [Candidatus Peribacteria bacterium RIFCSPHIGHO2_01_FULL_49_38]OGJ59179.1 MAG: hypothetical protein A3D11_04090 [Candidatus Peribacteria bacterium RIFCSPHIGHO2_02_FULL_49_16]
MKGIVSYADIHSIFSKSRFGEKLKQEVRFGQYKPENVTCEEWKELLGPDVCNLQHLWHVYNRTRAFLTFALRADPDSYSPEEQEKLLLTALCHDWGEACVGDHPYGTKTHDLELREIEAIHRIIDEIVHDAVLRIKLHTVTDTIVNGKVDHRSGATDATKLQESFEAIEHTDYMRTPIRAWEKHQKMPHTELRARLRAMGHLIVPAHINILTEYAKRFPVIHHYLFTWRKQISTVIADNTEEVLRAFPLQGYGFDADQMNNIRKEWKKWITTATSLPH